MKTRALNPLLVMTPVFVAREKPRLQGRRIQVCTTRVVAAHSRVVLLTCRDRARPGHVDATRSPVDRFSCVTATQWLVCSHILGPPSLYVDWQRPCRATPRGFWPQLRRRRLATQARAASTRRRSCATTRVWREQWLIPAITRWLCRRQACQPRHRARWPAQPCTTCACTSEYSAPSRRCWCRRWRAP